MRNTGFNLFYVKLFFFFCFFLYLVLSQDSALFYQMIRRASPYGPNL